MYATADELKLAIGFQVTAMQGTAEDADFEDVLEVVLTDVGNTIDAMISPRIDPSTVSENPILKRIALAIARYDMWGQYARNTIPESVAADKKEAFAMLEKIQKGQVTLLAEGSEDVGTVESEFTSATQVFDTVMM